MRTLGEQRPATYLRDSRKIRDNKDRVTYAFDIDGLCLLVNGSRKIGRIGGSDPFDGDVEFR